MKRTIQKGFDYWNYDFNLILLLSIEILFLLDFYYRINMLNKKGRLKLFSDDLLYLRSH